MNALVLYLTALLVFLVLAVFFAGAETALMATNRLRLKAQGEGGDRRAEQLQRILANTDRLLGVLLLGNTLSNIAAASLVTYFIASYTPKDWAEVASIIGTTALTLVVLIFCELTPKIIAAAYADQVSRRMVGVVRVVLLLLSPFARLAVWVANRTVRLFGLDPKTSPFVHALSEEEIRAIIAGSTPGSIAEDRREMLANVLEIGATQVRSVMIPRGEVTAADIAAPMPDILELIAHTNYSRIPVYRGTFDNIVGILNVKDLLVHLDHPAEINLQAIVRPVHFVPDTARLEVVLKQLQSMHQHMAVVVDEFGGVEGIVTLEDLLEEIVGEIRDEHDTEIEAIRSLGPETYSVAGSLPVRDFSRFFGTKVPESRDYTTIVGFLQARTGRLLHEGENVRFQDLTFSIEKMEGFKILSVRVRVPAQRPEREEQPAPVGEAH